MASSTQDTKLAGMARKQAQLPRRLPGWGPDLVAILPAAIVVSLWVAWGHSAGGYFSRSWYPGAIGLVVLGTAVSVATRRVLPPTTSARVALGLLAGWVAWSYLSLAWAGSVGSALESSNKLLCYLVGAWTLSILPWRLRSAGVVLGLWSLGVTVVCAVSLLSALGVKDLSGYVLEWRYQDPIGYANGAAALGIMAFFPALALGSRRETPVVLQALLLGASVFLLEFSLLPQSRGSFLGAVVALPAFLLLMPERLRLLPRAAVVGGAFALAAPAVLNLYDAGEAGERVVPVLHEAARQMALSVAIATVAALLVGVIERRARPRPAAATVIRRVTVAVVLICAAGAVVFAAGHADRAWTRFSHEWRAFQAGDPSVRVRGQSRLETLAYNQERKDYYRVGWALFREHPGVGVGAGNYERNYTARRRYPKHARFAHDIWLRALADTGIVGGLLLAAFVLAVLAGTVLRFRGLDARPRALAVAAVTPLVYLLVHASFDWLDEIPALAGPAVALPFVGLAAGGASRRMRPTAHRLVAGRVAVVAAVVAALIALVPAYLSVRLIERAFARWPASSKLALIDTDRAARWNPLSIAPQLAEGTIAIDSGAEGRARAVFRKALRREENWYSHFELALIEAHGKRFGRARLELRRAQQLDRSDPLLASVAQRLRKRAKIEPAKLNAAIRREINSSFTTAQR